MIYFLLILYNITITSLSFLLVPFAILFNNQKLKEHLFLVKKEKKKTNIWLHGASVGELLSCVSLVKYIQKQYPNYHFIITSHTNTSKKTISEKLDNISHYYLPLDSKYLVKRFLKYHNFKLILWIEQDFIPNFLQGINKEKIPLLLLNARMSNRSFTRWKKYYNFTNIILKNFTAIYPMSLFNKEKFDTLTNQDNKFLGNLKYTNIETSYKKEELKKLQEYLQDTTLFLALSTHKEEEDMIVENHQRLKKKITNLYTIIIPRHPERACSLKKSLQETYQERIIKFSEINYKNKKESILLVDSIGKVNLFTKLVDLTFVGKSLSSIKKGGHNILEPLSMGSYVIFGSNIQNFQEEALECQKQKAGIQVQSKEELYQATKKLLLDKNLLLEKIQNTYYIKDNSNKILNNYIKELKCFLK